MDYELRPDDDQVQFQQKTLLDEQRFILGTTTGCSTLLLDDIRSEQTKDPDFQVLNNNGTLSSVDNIYYSKNRLFVPTKLIPRVLRKCHDDLLAGHPGSQKTYHLISRSYWWPSLQRNVNDYVQSCDVCSRAKPICMKPAGLLHPLPIAPCPWYSILMDFITDLPSSQGFNSILVVVDRFSKMAHFIPCTKTINAQGLATLFIQHIVCAHGLPHNIVSDRGPQFSSQFWLAVLNHCKIKRNLTSAFHPQSDGQTERTNQTLEQFLWIYADPLQLNWVTNLPFAELTYNSTYHDAIERSPFMATYGFEPPTNLDTELLPTTPPSVTDWLLHLSDQHIQTKLQLEWTTKQMTKFANCHCRPVTLQVGDSVFLNRQNIATKRPCRKLDWKQFGPFKVIEVITPVTYRLDLPTSFGCTHNAFHISLLSKQKKSTLTGCKNEPPPPLLVDTQGALYAVNNILDSKLINGKTHYLIAWQGYGPEDNTWEPEENLTDCQELLQTFKDSRQMPKHCSRGVL